ncbi:MAG: hypothetical protein IMX01_07085 [Limnochordaceae bacterium]|nr:hypothetical protein [Limnochordaceae bacterium]
MRQVGLADREAVQALLAQDPTVALAYAFSRAGRLPGPQEAGLQLGVFWRQPQTGKALPPGERTSHRLELEEQLATILGAEVDIVDLDTASFPLRHRAARWGVCLKARPEAELLRYRFEQFARREEHRRRRFSRRPPPAKA